MHILFSPSLGITLAFILEQSTSSFKKTNKLNIFDKCFVYCYLIIYTQSVAEHGYPCILLGENCSTMLTISIGTDMPEQTVEPDQMP